VLRDIFNYFTSRSVSPQILLAVRHTECWTEEKRTEHATAADAPPVHYWYDAYMRKHTLIATPLSWLISCTLEAWIRIQKGTENEKRILWST